MQSHFLIISGMSGAGKTQVVRTLEDLNFFCIDNLPATLIPKFSELCRQTSEDKVALVGFSVNPDDEELLDMYIIDHHSHTFGYPDFDEWTMYGDSKPEATMSGVYVKLTLQRK